MSAGWLVYVILIVALLAAAAWAVESLCRQLALPARWSWLAAAVAAVALVVRAALAGDGSSIGMTLAGASVSSTPAFVAARWTLLAAVRDAIGVAGTALASTFGGAARMIPAWLVGVAAMVWLGASAVALAVLALVHRRIRRARRSWPEAELHGSRVRIAPDVGPAVVGVVRPEIVVPRWLLGCTSAEQRLVLAHESEHLRGRDHLLLGAGSVVVALLPWHPAAWWMLARLRLAIELDCDARVLRRGVPAREYGATLIDLAGRCSGFGVGATALADEGSHLERRLLAMNANRARRRWLRAGLLGTAAGLALLAACEAKVPTGPEIDAMDVGSVQRAATTLRPFNLMHGDSTVFFVNGREVDALTANSLTPNQIASIDISKGSTPATASVIRITTNGEAPAYDRGASSGMRRVHESLSGTGTGASGAMRLRTPGTAADAPLILIDGVRVEATALHAIDPKSILSVDVIKGAAATALSTDPAAKNGIIKVITKKQ